MEREEIRRKCRCWECGCHGWEGCPRSDAEEKAMNENTNLNQSGSATGYVWHRVCDGDMPEKGAEVLGVLQGCDSGRRIIRTVEYVLACDHAWESDGFEIANCWDVTHWGVLPELPTNT